jgi:hypothetical protein
MMDYLSGPVKHDAFFKKYAHKKFLKGMLMVLFTYASHSLIVCSIHGRPQLGQAKLA